MKKMLLICLATILSAAAPLWAAEDPPSQPRQSGSWDYENMGPGMMGPGSGYHGRGSGMMGYGDHTGRRMGPDYQGWQNMSPEQQAQWQQMRADFMQDTLPLRKELSAKQMELETLWEQRNPDPEKVKALSNRITELRSQLDEKHDAYLIRCRKVFGDRGWTCPGGVQGN